MSQVIYFLDDGPEMIETGTIEEERQAVQFARRGNIQYVIQESLESRNHSYATRNASIFIPFNYTEYRYPHPANVNPYARYSELARPDAVQRPHAARPPRPTRRMPGTGTQDS